MKSYVTFNKESNQTVSVYYELLSPQRLPGRVPSRTRIWLFLQIFANLNDVRIAGLHFGKRQNY